MGQCALLVEKWEVPAALQAGKQSEILQAVINQRSGFGVNLGTLCLPQECQEPNKIHNMESWISSVLLNQ
jgi:hypothetical protein